MGTIKNNNPGNIRLIKTASGKLPTAFIGEIRPNAGAFRSYANLETGVRSLMMVLQNDMKRGLDTIGKIIPSYAPKGDGANNPLKYIKDVSTWTGLPATKKLSNKDLAPLVKAITRAENTATLPNGLTERVYNNLSNDSYFKNLPATKTALYPDTAKTKGTPKATATDTSGLLGWWHDNTKRTEVLTVGAIVIGGALLYRNAKKRKNRTRRAA